MSNGLRTTLAVAGMIQASGLSTTFPIRRAFDKEGWMKDKKKRKASKKSRKKNR